MAELAVAQEFGVVGGGKVPEPLQRGAGRVVAFAVFHAPAFPSFIGDEFLQGRKRMV